MRLLEFAKEQVLHSEGRLELSKLRPHDTSSELQHHAQLTIVAPVHYTQPKRCRVKSFGFRFSCRVGIQVPQNMEAFGLLKRVFVLHQKERAWCFRAHNGSVATVLNRV